MSGYVAMSRNWQDHDIFAGDEYSRRDAWAWLIANAAWRPTKVRVKGSSVDLQRGELCFAQRFLAEKWGWSKSKTDRFIAVLRAEGMISTRSKIGATAGHQAGQGQSIITVCNYDAFQTNNKQERGNAETEIGATAGQQRGKEEPSKPLNQEEKKVTAGAAAFEFDGRVIRLTALDFKRWAKAFPLLDLRAVLQSRDDWLATEADDATRKKWFISTSNHLASLSQRAKRDERDQDGWAAMP